MSRRRWILVLITTVCAVLALAWAVHGQQTWHPVAHGPRTMPLSQIVRWGLFSALVLSVIVIFVDAWDTAKNGRRPK